MIRPARSSALLALAVLAVSSPGFGAELTKIASSFEEDDPFGMFLEVGFERTQHRAKIVREHHQRGSVEDVSELRFIGIDSRLNLDLRVGLWQDLEFRYGLPIVFQHDQSWGYAAGTTDENSTIANNCLQANGELLDPGCPASRAGARSLFDADLMTPISAGGRAEVLRGGLGDMRFGLAYAFFNQTKDDTKPTWIVGIDYTAPTAERADPGALLPKGTRGKLGDKTHKYKFYTSFSRRIGVADPYFQLHYTLPYRGPGWYSNCDSADPRSMGHPENCGTPEWTRSDTGIRIPHRGGILVGTELVAYDNKAKKQKVALDARADVTYVSPGRYLNMMGDLFHKLLYTQDYLEVGGQLGVVAHAAEYFHLKVAAGYYYDTEHILTSEVIGKDVDGSGDVSVSNKDKSIELHPSYDWRADTTSRRFRATETSIFRLDVSASFNF